MNHLLVSLGSYACSVGDLSEVLISLYENTETRFLSEKFVMHFDREGNRLEGDKNSCGLFTDLSAEDTQRDLYLVLQIFRKGRLKDGGSVRRLKQSLKYRRPWGISVLSLKDLYQIRPENELDYFLRVHVVDPSETQFHSLHESLIKKQMQMTSRLGISDKQNQGITLCVQILQGELKTVKMENPTLFSRNIVPTQRMGFSDFINPGEVRNDLYLTLSGAEVDRGKKKAAKNVEVKVAVYNQDYEVIPGCILGANGDPLASEFFSYVSYHSNSPHWNETIKLSIPIERFNTAHIRLDLWHCSSNTEKVLVGFAFLELTVKGNITRQNKKYDLCLYKYDEKKAPKNYLRLPCLHESSGVLSTLMPSKPVNLPVSLSTKEWVTVETFLCSSKFAQKSELLSVLQWSSNPRENIPRSLENLLTLKGQELVRYLQDVLDALFDMLRLEDSEKIPFSMNVFHALVYIFYLLQEDMFEKFAVVLEDYLEKSFASTVAHRDLLKCLKKYLETVYTCTDFEEKGQTKKVFKVLEEIFKFAVKSSLLHQRLHGTAQTQEFWKNLKEVFEDFGRVLSSSEKELRKSQALLLTNLHKAFIPLLHLLPTGDLAEMVVFLLNRTHKEASGSVLRAKTQFVKHCINSKLLLDAASREKLLHLCVSHLKRCLIHKYNLALTANTLGDLLSVIFDLKETTDVKEEVTRIIKGLFDVTVRTMWTVNEAQREEAGSLLIACLTEMLRLMDVTHYKKLMNGFSKPEPLRVRMSVLLMPHSSSSPASSKDFLNRVLHVFRNLVISEDFPPDWTTMKMITNNVMLTSIQYIADDLTINFLSGGNFDRELWHNFFLLAVDFITQRALQLELYSEAKRSQIKDRYDDMRVPVGFQIHSLWNQLGTNKQHLILEIINPFLRVTMVPQQELRKATIPIFFDILQCEMRIQGNLGRVEKKMYQELDSLILEHHGDADYKELLKTILLEKSQSEPELQEEGKRFVFSVTDLLEKLLDYREIMNREEQRDTKMHCTFNILDFYKDSRKDMYIRYISRLYELHYHASNFVEAGLTLRLYAQLLSWGSGNLPAEMSYSEQTEAERKEELLTKIVDCFDKGKAWEYGIPVCKELGEHYEKTFQYKKLGQILQKQASFFYSILEGMKLRQDPSYYRVAYYGNTFPVFLKNKAFIYRGDECLKLSTIMSQVVTEYPNATILTTNSPIDEACKHHDAQFIQIVSVKPVPQERPEYVGKEVPSEISSFYQTNEVDTFQFDRPYHRENKDKNNEFKSLCLERTVLKSSYKLPGILRWYEVVNIQVIQLCPVETATDTIKQMNTELRLSMHNAVTNPEQNLRHLTMRLQGVISGAVNGGIPKYQEAFFNDEYTSRYPADAQYIDELRSCILDQLQLLDRGLGVHGKLISSEIQPLHQNLVEIFAKIKSSMGYQSPTAKQRGSYNSIGTNSQRPSTPSSTSLNSSSSNRSSVVSGNDISAMDEDQLYVETPDEENHPPSFPPPPYPDKRRCSSLRALTLSNSSFKLGLSARPLSAIVTPTFATQSPPLTVELPLPRDDAPGGKQFGVLPRKQSIPSDPFGAPGLNSSIPGHSSPSLATPEKAPPLPDRPVRSRDRGMSIQEENRNRPATEIHRSMSERVGRHPVDPSTTSPNVPPLPGKRNTGLDMQSNMFGGSARSITSLDAVQERTPTDYNANTMYTSAATPPLNISGQTQTNRRPPPPPKSTVGGAPPPLLMPKPRNATPPVRSPGGATPDDLGFGPPPVIPSRTQNTLSPPPPTTPGSKTPPPIPKRKPSSTST
ncbi:dedicator of cytokinesis protein 4 [Aplysia californica]|uniref:Dedicator of cytokinesis protein 4 n=1 Tax=Aplysia californica TaxID=6500 RepID=A0ABM0ZUB5_APLCA|nr:dedicator of cytokinesis protein 4 [Aplysia californica]